MKKKGNSLTELNTMQKLEAELKRQGFRQNLNMLAMDRSPDDQGFRSRVSLEVMRTLVQCIDLGVISIGPDTSLWGREK